MSFVYKGIRYWFDEGAFEYWCIFKMNDYIIASSTKDMEAKIDERLKELWNV